MGTAQLVMTKVPVTSKYGNRILKATGKENFHKGTDHAFGNAMGVSTYGDGVVVHAGWGSGANAERGIYVEVEHASGVRTSYHSLSRIEPGIVKGKRVTRGQILGYGGKTAAGASGHHVHVGLWLDGQHKDETRYLKPGVVVSISNTGKVTVTDLNVKPIPAPAPAPAPAKRKRAKMYLIWGGPTGYLVTEDGALALASPQIYNLFYRVINSDQLVTPFGGMNTWIPGAVLGKSSQFLQAEVDIMNAHLKLLSVQKETQVTIDPTKLASAVSDELRKKGVTVDLKDLDWSAETGELIAKQVATAFEGAIPRITNAIVKKQGESLVAGSK